MSADALPDLVPPPTLVMVVAIGAWRCTVHYPECASYLRSEPRNRNRPVSPGMAIRACRACRPPETLVGPFLRTVSIGRYTAGGLGRLDAGPHAGLGT